MVNKRKKLGGGESAGQVNVQAIAIELATGKVVGPVPIEPIRLTLGTSPAGIDGRWFIGCGKPGMGMMNASGKDSRQVLPIRAAIKGAKEPHEVTKTNPGWDFCMATTPALAGAFMYFRGSDCLWCYDLVKR